MKKLIFIDGLPGVGKTYLKNAIKDKKVVGLFGIDEIVNPDIEHNINSENQDIYLENDKMKVSMYDEGFILIDRSPISTIAYNKTRCLLNPNFKGLDLAKWEKTFGKYLQSNDVTIYYLQAKNGYYIPYEDEKDPYGSIENQILLEKVSLKYLCKYVKNYKIVEYEQNDIKELIDEIINQFMCA